MANYLSYSPSYAGGLGGSGGGYQPSQQDLGNTYQYLFKFIIIGDEAVGKTCLLLQFTDKRYRTTHQVTVGVEFGSRTVDLDGTHIKLQCWDTAGQDRFRSIIRSYYRGAAGALLVYDTTRRDSFEHVLQWLQEARANADPDLIITLVGNKCDKVHERQVSYEEGHAFAHKYGLYFLETSAVTGHMVDEAFMVTTKLVHNRNQQREVSDPMSTKASSAGGGYSQNEYLGGGVTSTTGYNMSSLKLSPNGPIHQGGQPPQQDSCCG
eukprot:TRINITY_DN27300_c0_g1_i1.p1 TRINITY_DN27300_c0_g1~~TRINITY_DN27300_c0_g1_i1.p1  ORF type:complete len:274 (+),score=37.64 TRINITY_DN27300_c0_g1_i1:30-824(+)